MRKRMCPVMQFRYTRLRFVLVFSISNHLLVPKEDLGNEYNMTCYWWTPDRHGFPSPKIHMKFFENLREWR